MGQKFYRRTTPDYTIMPNATYADLFDNNKTTTDIQSGTVGGIQTTTLFVGDYNTAAKPTFGTSTVVGAKIGLYINSITSGQTGGSAGLKAFSIDTPVGNREGGKDTAGTIVTNSSIAQFCAFHNNTGSSYMSENFAGVGTASSDVIETATSATVIQQIGPYLSQSDGYDYGVNFGQGNNLDLSGAGVSKSTHHNRYGQTLDDGTKIYKMETDSQWGDKGWKSIKEKKLFWFRNNEWWDDEDVGGGGVKGSMSQHNDSGSGKVKFTRELTIDIPPEEKVQTISTDTTFFDIVNNSATFRGTKTDVSGGDIITHQREAYGNFTFSSANVLSGGYALHLDSLYMHRTNSSSNPWYPKMKDTSGNELEYSALQQTSFASKIVPMPVEVGNSNRKEKRSAGGHSPIPTIEIDMNFEEIAPMLLRFNNVSTADSNGDGTRDWAMLGGERSATGEDTGCAWRYRLNRSIVITFGSEAPDLEDSLFMYIKKHFPSSGGAGDLEADSNSTTYFNPTWLKSGAAETNIKVGGDGAITTAKSFFGTAFVNYDGHFGYYNLEAYGGTGANNYATQSTAYDDLSFRCDDLLGEVCFNNAPTTIEDGALNNWLRLAFQVDPELMGANYAIYDAKSGDIVKTPDILVNGKSLYPNASDGTEKLKVTNREDWPKYMTIWQNNYQAVKGKMYSNLDGGSYESGLVFGKSDDGGDDRANARLVQANAGNSEIQDGAQLTSVPFHLIKPGTSMRYVTESSGEYSNSSEIGVTRHDRKLTDDGFLIISFDQDDKDYDKGEPLVYDPQFCVDTQVTGANEDMRISAFIDAISFKNFNILHLNATPNANNTVPKRIKIPTTTETIPFGYTLNNAVPENVYESGQAYANSYICLGFDNYTDLGFATNIDTSSSDAHFLMNDFKVSNSSTTDTIITNIDSKFSHVRAGYSSSVEDYGIQCRKKLTQEYGDAKTQGVASNNAHAGYITDGLSNLSPFFDNNQGSPNYTNRGLKVGNDTSGFELAIGSDTARQIDRFTQKGILTCDFDARTVDSTAELSAAVTSATQTNVNVDNGAVFADNMFIKIEDEVMKVINVGIPQPAATLTVERGAYGTTADTHPNTTQVNFIAVPEKRECLFVSARVTSVEDSKSITVDEPSIFDLPANTEYIIYKHAASHASYSPVTLKVARKSDNQIYFDTPHNISVDNTDKIDMMVSPKKYWLVLEITNIGGEITKAIGTGSGGQSLTVENTDGIAPYMTVKGTSTFVTTVTDSSNTITLSDDYTGTSITLEATTIIGNNQNYTKKILPEKSYQNVVGITTDTINFGATFNESLYNDGNYINNRSLESFEDAHESVVTLKDYGFGDFDDDKELGGHAGYLGLNIQNDVSKYKEIDISGLITTEGIETNTTVPILICTDDPEESFKINIDTETGTNPTYLITEFEDELLDKPELFVEPDKENAFYPRFKWKRPSKDAWYGFIIVDDKSIENQYANAVMHHPLNESGPHGKTAGAPTEKISGLTTIISGPLYDIEGLAGYSLNFDGTNDYIRCGTPNTNINTAATSDATATATSEMSIVAHIIPDSGASDDRYIVSQEDTNGRKFSINLNSSNQVVAKVYRTDSDYVSLTSSSVIVTNGEVPTNIILTVDTTLPSGNVKLFINGKLEDLTGAALGTGTTNNWQKDATMQSANSYVVIGNSSHSSVTLDRAFDGKIEEVVIYDKCIYPVVSTSQSPSFLFTKPISELVSGQSLAQTKSCTAKLFMKDYHNIRGSTENEVASSTQISWRKAGFALDTT